jgi:HEPN domain-containing protein
MGMSLADEIFPNERSPGFVQTEWAEGWTYASIGFAEAARFLTENRAEFGASIDQAGLAVFFLQRHRMELAMKELLAAKGADVPTYHELTRLWKVCSEAVGASSTEWKELASIGDEIVALIDKHDRSSHTFRYPVDTNGNLHDRPAHIDLEAVDAHVSNFVGGLDGYQAYMEESEQAAREYEQEMEQYVDY